MRTSSLKNSLGVLLLLMSVMIVVNCSSDSSSSDGDVQSNIIVTGGIISFGEVDVLSNSASQNIIIRGSNLSSELEISVEPNFEISLDDVNYTSEITISKSDANNSDQTLYVRFSPSMSALESVFGTLTIESNSATTRTINLNGIGLSTGPTITVNRMSFNFDDTQVFENSASLTLLVNGNNLNSVIDLTVTEGFEISLDNAVFLDVLQISSATSNDETTVYIRFSPEVIGSLVGALSVVSSETDDIDISLGGEALSVTHNYSTFSDEALGFGGGFNQAAEQTFVLHSDMSNISQIKMYLQIDCPTTGCDDWDRYANIMVKDSDSGDWYEIGRYITPYWVGTQLLPRGLEFDVTDFKSLLTGSVELRIYIENWTAKADLVSVDFDFIEGTPDYEFYAVSDVMQYNANSLEGVPYGVNHDFDLTKSVSIPSNAESTHLRTIISGWGHATPNDSGGRGCAEWCYRTHDIKINGSTTFQHNMGPIGCASNPINNQSPGNWVPDRAGWCPGMVVPVRLNQFGTTMAGSSFSFEYDYEDWFNNGGNGDAFYATSTFVIVKSSTPINKPVVTD